MGINFYYLSMFISCHFSYSTLLCVWMFVQLLQNIVESCHREVIWTPFLLLCLLIQLIIFWISDYVSISLMISCCECFCLSLIVLVYVSHKMNISFKVVFVFYSLLTLKSVVIPIILWILPEQCDRLWRQNLCDHTAALAIYSFLRSGLVQIFYVSALYWH
jgi:hypothetical protein